MRVKLVKSLCGDEILAESLYSSEKVLLIPKGTALKSEYIELLYSLEIKEIYVEDIYEMEERRNVFLSKEVEQQLYEEIKCILEKYIYKDEKILKKIRPLAKKIVHIIVEGDFKELLDYDIHAAELYTHTLKVTYSTFPANISE